MMAPEELPMTQERNLSKSSPEILVCLLALATIFADVSLQNNLTAVLGSMTIVAAACSLWFFKAE